MQVEDDLLPHCKTGGRLRNGACQKGHAYASSHKKNHNLRTSSEIATNSGSNFEEDQCAPFLMENHKRRPNTNQITPKKLESAKSSPSIIAKLMGLNELPPEKGLEKANKKSGRVFHKPTLSGLLNNTNAEFKDVFEVIEARNWQQDNRQNTEDRMMVKEFEGDFENYRDSFVKNMEKSNPLFAKHLLDLKCYPPHLHKGMFPRLKSGYVDEHVLSKNVKLINSDQRDNCGYHDHTVLDPKMGNVDECLRFRRTAHQNFLENLQSRRGKMWRFEAFGHQGDEYCNRNILKPDKLKRIDPTFSNEGTKSLAEMLEKTDTYRFEKIYDSHKYHRKLLKSKFAREGYYEKMEGSFAKLPQDVSPMGGKSNLLEREEVVKLRARKQKLRENFPIKGNYSSRHHPRDRSGNGFETQEKMLFGIDEGQNAGPMTTQLFAGAAAKKHETEKRASTEEKEECFLVMNFNRKTNSSEAEIHIPSPISVLEPIPMETQSCSSSLLKPDSDLHETDTQITEQLEVCMSSDDDSQGTTCNHKTSTLNLLRDEEEREFSYLLEMLIQSGIHRISPGRYKRKYHSCEFPVDPRLFERLEKRYSQMVTWSKSDRKLLFDLVNSVLAIVLAPVLDTHPWVRCDRHAGSTWGPDVLVERVWMVLSRERKKNRRGDAEERLLDSDLFQNWGDEINVIGKRIERMLSDEILEETVLGLFGIDS